MESQKQAIDRVIDALAPALNAEMDRMVQETQQNLEVEFQKKLQDTVREAEMAVRSLAEVQLAQTVAETRDRVRQEVTDELQGQFGRTLKETTDELRASLTKDLQNASAEWSAERARLSEQLEEARLFANVQQKFAEAGSQTEILVRFLRLAERFAPSVAVYLAKADGLALWKASVDAVFPQIVPQGTIDPALYFREITVRDKPVAAVCAVQPCRIDGLEFLVACLARAIESFGMKLRSPVPKITQPAPAPVETPGEIMHGEARRLARLLVSEIKLYHEQKVIEGRENSDLYARLQTEIDSSLVQYRQRVSSAVLASSDYFHEEVVRVLADNDASRLGGGYPGPKTP